ncbi:MAG TPA: hypothetical protein VKX49_07995 [Bryobacteraceae bacterium]|nr:hypothetical protein [Bryobacteraceae bacterium]
MFNRRWLLPWAVAPILGMPLMAQPVISARAGLIEFTDGAVFLDGLPVQQTPGRFGQMREGQELRTQDGRAELMLTPGVFLRVGDNSAVQMIANHLADTRVRLIDGTAIVDALNASPKTSVTILYGDYQVQVGPDGRYRFNAGSAELRVEDGKAQVVHNGDSLTVDAGHVVALTGGLNARMMNGTARDKLDNWDQVRTDSLAQSNQEAANTQDLSNAIDQWQSDPAAALSALGMSGYIPPPGYIPTPPYTDWVSSPYTTLGLSTWDVWNPWMFGRAGLFGIYGFPGTAGLYGVPLYRTYIQRAPLPGVSTYRYPSPIRPSTPIGVGAGSGYGIGTGIGVPRSPIYTGGGGVRPVPSAPMHGGVGAAGHAGGHR